MGLKRFWGPILAVIIAVAGSNAASALAISWSCVLTAEMIAAQSGLGALI
jgi:hypothetical protein